MVEVCRQHGISEQTYYRWKKQLGDISTSELKELRQLREENRKLLSAAFTLEPCDVVTTGTPSGVGGAMQPPRFLQAGDVVKIEIERIGAFENRVIEEPAETARM
jgi:hypothetical protein